MSTTYHTPNPHADEPTGFTPLHQIAPSKDEERQFDPQPMHSDDELPADDFESMPIGSRDCWDVFIPDDDELDPLPEPGDFWIEPD
jgi:hypothetical protein